MQRTQPCRLQSQSQQSEHSRDIFFFRSSMTSGAATAAACEKHSATMSWLDDL